MAAAYPELEERRDHLLEATRVEEERFLSTIEGGMTRFDEVAPRSESGPQGVKSVLSGSEAFKLYDTFGFPLDLTELMAEERGYAVDVEAFEQALEEQRTRSRADRAQSDIQSSAVDFAEGWISLSSEAAQVFLGLRPFGRRDGGVRSEDRRRRGGVPTRRESVLCGSRGAGLRHRMGRG